MKIGILGSGHIGRTLARKLAATGHEVKVANSRWPDTIDAAALSTGARAVRKEEAVSGVEVLILHPLRRHSGSRPSARRPSRRNGGDRYVKLYSRA